MAVKRRQALCIGAAWLASSLTVLAQPRKLRIGFLGGITPDASTNRNALDPFRQALRELGYVEGQNLEIHFRWAEGQPDRLPGLAAELVRLEPDVIVAMGPGPAVAAKRATTTVPVVAAVVDNPVETGLVADFVRPWRQRDRNQLDGRRGLRQAAATPEGARPVVASRRRAHESCHRFAHSP
jgi:putative ABC transport system substrate-binding protein